MTFATALSSTSGDCLPCQALATGTAPITPATDSAAVSGASPVPWAGVIGVEGEVTGDGRLIELNALTWDTLPLLIRYVPMDVGAHDNAAVVGQINTIERRPGGVIWATGTFDLDSTYGSEAMGCVKKKTQNGVSMDLDDVSFEIRVRAELLQQDVPVLDSPDGEPLPVDADGMVTLMEMKSGDELMVTTSARIRAATLVAIPAFEKARIELVDGGAAAGAGTELDTMPPVDGQSPSSGTTPNGNDCSCDESASNYDPECDCASTAQVAAVATARALAAAAAPMDPPAAWFGNPQLSEPTALTVTAEGRVYGHLAAWGTCHISHTHSGCVTPPHSAAGYAYFHTGTVLTSDGVEVPVGHITLDTRHAGERLTAATAAAHYEHTGTVVADVAAGEDSHGIWVSGALRPSASDTQIRALRSSPLSGDWRRISGNLELVAALAVNVPGFPVPRPRGLVAGGVAQTLVASGMLPPKVVRRPGTEGALSLDDLRYLKRLADRERAEDQRAALGSLSNAEELARRVRASALSMRAHRARISPLE